MSKKTALLAVVLLVAISGCMTFSVTSEVSSADTIEQYEMNISTSATVYGYLNEAAKEDGYDNFGEAATADLGSVPAEKIEYSEEIDGDEAQINIEMTNVNPENLSSVSVTKSDGTLIYEDQTFYNASETNTEADSEIGQEAASGFVLQYQVVMPNEITDSNADEVDGNTATWRRTGDEAFSNTSIRAESDAPSSVLPVSTPGFGIVPAVVALLVVSGLFWSRRTE